MAVISLALAEIKSARAYTTRNTGLIGYRWDIIWSSYLNQGTDTWGSLNPSPKKLPLISLETVTPATISGKRCANLWHLTRCWACPPNMETCVTTLRVQIKQHGEIRFPLSPASRTRNWVAVYTRIREVVGSTHGHTPAILRSFMISLSHSRQNTGVMPRLGHDHFFLNPF